MNNSYSRPGFLFLFLFAFAMLCQAQTDHGVPVDSFPSWREQALLVFTNVARTDPQGFRDKYIGNYQILLAKNFQAQRPVYWNAGLNRAARAHSIEMATVCGMQHNSCDGSSFSVRIKQYYTASGWLGENISTGYATPQAALIGWLRDDTGTSARAPAPDSSAYDGHRRIIMTSQYQEMGAGYARGPLKWYDFWTEDFGGGKSAFASRPVAAGSHLFLDTGKITFIAVYWDSAGLAPQSAQLILNGSAQPLALLLGTAGRGSYAATLSRSTACRHYYFAFKDAAGHNWRYPETGWFSTHGEGGCSQYYVPDSQLALTHSRPRASIQEPKIRTLGPASLSIAGLPLGVISIRLADIRGRRLPFTFQENEPGLVCITSRTPFSPGVYLIHMRTSATSPIRLRFAVFR